MEGGLSKVSREDKKNTCAAEQQEEPTITYINEGTTFSNKNFTLLYHIYFYFSYFTFSPLDFLSSNTANVQVEINIVSVASIVLHWYRDLEYWVW